MFLTQRSFKENFVFDFRWYLTKNRSKEIKLEQFNHHSRECEEDNARHPEDTDTI